MRRALGLFGATPRPRQDPEPQQTLRNGGGGGGFAQGGGMHRRRFVQDGEVPVTVVRRDEQAAAPLSPQSSRLQRVEAALAAETAARERAERALQEAQIAVQTLQTKIGHNELAKNEALSASKRDREEIITLRQEISGFGGRLKELTERAETAEQELTALRDDLAEERRARDLAERLLAEANENLEAANRPSTTGSSNPRVAVQAIERPPARRGRPPNPRPVEPELELEAEPVKWWLSAPAPKVAGKRR